MEPQGYTSIPEFNFQELKKNATLVILGKRRSGKTHAARYIYSKHLIKTKRTLVIAGNKDCAREWLSAVPGQCCVIKDIARLDGIRNYQDNKAKEGPIKDKYSITIIIDDCGADRTFMFHPLLIDIMSNGRHYGMQIVILLQYITQLHPQNRSQLDYVGILYTNNETALKKVSNEFSNSMGFSEFKECLKISTESGGMLWIDNTIHVGNSNSANLFYVPRSPSVWECAVSVTNKFTNILEKSIPSSTDIVLIDDSDSHAYSPHTLRVVSSVAEIMCGALGGKVFSAM